MIQKYINQICDIFDMESPKLSFDTSNFQTDTTLAQCSDDGKTIFINGEAKQTPDIFFAIAHELRHIWQIRTNKAYWFHGYKTAGTISTEAYNMQPAEIDANAFALIAMTDFLGLQPQFNGLSDNVKTRIFQRANEISNDFK